MAKNSNKIVYAVALVLFLGGLGYLIFSGLTQDSVYFLNVSEALAEDRGQLGNARLFGKVSSDNLEIVDGKLGADFDLIDKLEAGKSLRVAYRGALPDTFKPGVEVIVEGSFPSSGGAFTARTLVTKCPFQVRGAEQADGAGQGIGLVKSFSHACPAGFLPVSPTKFSIGRRPAPLSGHRTGRWNNEYAGRLNAAGGAAPDRSASSANRLPRSTECI